MPEDSTYGAAPQKEIAYREMPHSTGAEQSVVASMIMDKDAIEVAYELLKPEDFYHRQYGLVFSAITALHEEGKPADLVLLQDKLREKNAPEEISSLSFLNSIMDNTLSSVNIREYATIVAEKSMLRNVIRTNQEIENECFEGVSSVESILQDTEKKIFDLIQMKGGGGTESIKDIILRVVSRIDKASRNKGNLTGLATGFLDIDYMTSGLQRSDLILVAARPSMGKTAFVLNIAAHVAFRTNKAVALFSLEMSKDQLVNRLLAQEAHVDATKIRSGNLSEKDWADVGEATNVIARSKIIIDDTPGITVSELRSKCRKFKLEHDIQLVIIDYLQLMSGSGKRSESRQNEISEISRSLKAVARELDVPLIALSQLSREAEKRPDKRPMLSDLRESGAIEQDADVVMMIYRDDYYNHDSEEKNVAEIIIAKQRNGPVGTRKLAWLPEYTQFANLEIQ